MIEQIKRNKDKYLFVISGGVQYLLDMFIFSILVLVFGNNITFNWVSRISTGIVGFYLNGYFVFGTLKEQGFSRYAIAFFKFALLLFFMTIISSGLLGLFIQKTGMYFVLAKAVIEIILSTLSFVIQKYLVYQTNKK